MKNLTIPLGESSAQTLAKIFKHGNSNVIVLPVEMLKILKADTGDTVLVEARKVHNSPKV